MVEEHDVETIKLSNMNRGCGFITRSDRHTDVLHLTAIATKRTIRYGKNIEFDIMISDKYRWCYSLVITGSTGITGITGHAASTHGAGPT